jgi:threonine/homoserine/homoserine lactone efflux protein
MSAERILAFWAVVLLLVVVPGPDWAFTLGTVLSGGSAVAAVAGLTVGYAVLTVIVSAGVGSLIAHATVALTILTVVGGAYLVSIGAATLRAPSRITANERSTRPTARSTLLRGVGVSGLNPKALVLFVALLPQFTSATSRWPLPAQMAVLGSLFTLTCAAFYLALGAFAGRTLLARPAAARALSRTSGVAMIVIGSLLVIEHVS